MAQRIVVPAHDQKGLEKELFLPREVAV